MNHEEKDITVLWQGDFEGGTLIIFFSKQFDDILFWKIFDPGFAEPITGHYHFIANSEFNLELFINICLNTIRHTYLGMQQGIKDECINSGIKIQ